MGDLASALDRTPTVSHVGWAATHGANGKLINGIAPSWWFCPTADLPTMWTAGQFQVACPSYVGVSGATHGAGFEETRVSPCCEVDGDVGQISGGGVLIPNRAVRLSEVSDGSSKTLVIGESTGLLASRDQSQHRIDGAFPMGWITGTRAYGTPPNYRYRATPSDRLTPSSWNITTLRYRLNETDYDLPGIDDDRGANNPLASAHPGGVPAAFLDGAVTMLNDDVELLVLKQLATRDDGMIGR
jgi:hypothetical protein